MRTIERILCCTDLSDNATPAVHAAVKIAELHNAELTILYVMRQPEAAHAPLVDELKKKITQRAQEEIAKVCPPEDDTPVRAKTEIRRGPVIETVLAAARELGADLLVAGSHGHTGNLKGGPGHIAEQLVRKASCSVLLVRPEFSDEYSRIAVATDFSDYGQVVLERGVDLAKRFGRGELGLYHVCHLPEEYWLTGRSEAEALKRVRGFAEQHAREFLKAAKTRGVQVETVIVEGSEAPAILTLVKKRKTELLVMGSHGRTTAGAVLLGSVAERTLRACPCSLWIEIDPKRRMGILQALGHIMGITE
ncbi:MAG: universal stress protein [Planctomycetes bacterium]|nr:universal stress protein [Planctomycetota bacterium]